MTSTAWKIEPPILELFVKSFKQTLALFCQPFLILLNLALENPCCDIIIIIITKGTDSGGPLFKIVAVRNVLLFKQPLFNCCRFVKLMVKFQWSQKNRISEYE